MNLKSDATVWGICDKGSFYLIMLRRANGYDNVKIVKFGFVFFPSAAVSKDSLRT